MIKLQRNAVTVSWVLIALLFIAFTGIVAGGLFLQSILTLQVEETNGMKLKAMQSTRDAEKANELKAYLESHTDDVQRAAAIVGETKTYQYQNQIIEDINRYANSAGVTVLGFDFPTSTTAPKNTAGLKSIAAVITLQNPVSYTNYLKFLKLIEQNLTKMQITDISVAPDPKASGEISTPTIGLQVYVK